MSKVITHQDLILKLHILNCRKKYLNSLLKKVREVRKEITDLQAEYEEMEHNYIFKKLGGVNDD